MANINVTPGTGTTVAGDTVGGILYQNVKLDVGAAGVSVPFTNTLGTVQNLNAGTVTVVSNLTNGSANILTGTIQSSGTTTGVGVVTNLTNGSVNLLTGTVTSVTNVAGGTIKQNPYQLVNQGTSIVVVGTSGAGVWGTIVATSGNGVKQYVSGVAAVVQSGTVDVAIAFGIAGSTGAGVLLRGQFPAGGGIQRELNPVAASGTGGTIAYWMGGAGTVAFTVDYAQGA